MTTPTHITFAEFVYLLILTTTGVPLSFGNALAIGVASILADLDTGASLIGRAFPSVALRIERKFGHRTLTHSVVFMVGLATLLLPLLAWDSDLYACLCAGYATHPFLDSMTVNGVKLFYPFSTVRCVFPLEVNHPHRYRMQTGSRLDRALGLVFLIGCIPTFLIAAQGYERFIRFTQKNIESAVRDYNEFSRTSLVYADISAHNLLTKEHIAGRFEIIGALDNHTLLFRSYDRRLHSLGSEYQSEYVVESALCQRGDPIRVNIHQVDMENQPLIQIQEHVEQGRETQFFGQLRTSDNFSVPQDGNEFSPITGIAGTLKFNYAFYDDIKDLGLENLFISRGTLTVRTIIPQSEAVDSVRAQANAPKSAPQFTRVSFQINAKVPLELSCQEGDTVADGQLLARWGTLIDIQNKIDLNLRRIAALEDERDLRLSEVDGKISKAKITFEGDSIGFALAGQLSRAGYAAPFSLEKAQAKYMGSRMLLNRLRTTKLTIRGKTALQIQRARNENEALLAKEKAATAASESRSPVRGIIEDLRQSVNNNKLLVLILVRRI